MNPWLITLVCAYLLGSIPFGYLLVRAFHHRDIREVGSGNTGATNVAREGKFLGIVTLALDLGKAMASILIARHLVPGDYNLEVAAAIAVIVGHIYPVWLTFRGGKGVACALGVFLMLVPKAALGILLVFLVVVTLTRFVSLASILGAASFPLFGFYFVRHPSPLVVFGFLFIPALIIWKHRSNISRLLAGTEPRFGKSGGKSSIGKASA